MPSDTVSDDRRGLSRLRVPMLLAAIGLAAAVTWLPVHTAYACLCDRWDYETDGDVAFAGTVRDIGMLSDEQSRVPVTFEVAESRSEIHDPLTVMMPLGSSCGMEMQAGEGWRVVARWSTGGSRFLQADRCSSTREVSLDRPVGPIGSPPAMLVGAAAVAALAGLAVLGFGGRRRDPVAGT